MLCLLSPSSCPLQHAQERRGGFVGCRVFCWGCFGCFPGSSSEAGVCLDLSITARLEAATPMTALLTITSQHPGHLLVSLCIRAGHFCVIAGGQASCSRGAASPPDPWKGQTGDRSPSSGLLAVLAQPALHDVSQGSSRRGLCCIQPHHVPFILHSSYVVGVAGVLSLDATEP